MKSASTLTAPSSPGLMESRINSSAPSRAKAGAKTLRCAILCERIGPYHFARYSAFAGRMPVTVIESFGIDSTYAWNKVLQPAGFDRRTLSENPGATTARELSMLVFEALMKANPSVVVIPGWGSRAALAGLQWCLINNVPAVVLSASFADGEHRAFWKESIKRRIVRLFAAGVGGGAPQAAYLTSLGIPPNRVFTGCDVVDNSHFADLAGAARLDAPRLRQSLGLPDKFFLCVCRFIEEKNLPTLLNAYAAYRSAAGADAWKLVLAGDGPLKPELLQQRKDLGLNGDLLLPGFLQYHELPGYYGLASGFVLPSLSETWGLVVNEAMAAGLPVLVSNRCGCAVDLVSEGRNGFAFDPATHEPLSRCLHKLAEGDAAAMGEASRSIIASWSPETFATNLQLAVTAACTAPPRQARSTDRWLLSALLNCSN